MRKERKDIQIGKLEREVIQIGKLERKLPLLTDDMIVYTENTKTLTKNLELVICQTCRI